MSDYIPYGGFRQLKNVSNSDVFSICEKNPIGYILEVDLEYPAELHKLHNYYPLATEKLAIPYDMLSNCCKKIADIYGMKVGDAKKLIPNLSDKTNYVVHYRNLQLHLSLGIKLTKTHKILKFKLSVWMKNYINFSTEKRTKATNKFEKKKKKIQIDDQFCLWQSSGKLKKKNQC